MLKLVFVSDWLLMCMFRSVRLLLFRSSGWFIGVLLLCIILRWEVIVVVDGLSVKFRFIVLIRYCGGV